jgi:hypothetical protein
MAMRGWRLLEYNGLASDCNFNLDRIRDIFMDIP